jgi:hypothetical protein
MLVAAGHSTATTSTNCLVDCTETTDGPPFQSLAKPDSSNSEPAENDWRLVRIRNPAGGPDTVSIMRTADSSQSDIDLAGIALRCSATPEVNTTVVVIEPLAPGSHPKVTLRIGPKIAKFDAMVLKPFTVLLLPRAATSFLIESWQTDPNLSVNIERPSKTTNGIVSLAGLGPAFDDLLKGCLTP